MQLGLLLAVGIGGFIGAVLRFSISHWVNTLSNSSFPFGTLSVNVLGSFFIGFLFLYFQQVNLSLYQKSLLITGLLGALTTFSTFSLDTVLLIQEELYIKAFSNVFLNVILSIGATLLGMIIFKRIYS
ncbi:MAG: CrcB protein [uncultured Sulfurovum sp.]|uniref:Fluoride-specific ion channel FluC n=1 Tax=uncultured Sulfurovum sp. TaxID=269237 RepID=A0A6S6T8K5_9BACT|nr:MAG: CrcB protein [uncultured Sulfurovum sp.]